MKSGGSIINITSLAAEQGFPNNVAYVSSKGGLKQLTKAMAIDLAKKNIRVNSIGPGYVKTKMTEKSYSNSKKKLERVEKSILNRWGEPNDLIGIVIFLATKSSSFVTGTNIIVDGGLSIKGI